MNRSICRNTYRSAPLVIAIAGALSLLACGVAMAEDDSSSPLSPDQESVSKSPNPVTKKIPAAEDSSANKAVNLETIVVTANKRAQNIRDVASGISVVGEQQIERSNATQLSDYADYVPGFQVTSDGTPGQTRVSMRGIAVLSSGSTVGTYLDETPVGSSGLYQAATNFALDLLPYDIARVEVLRGPQGTLYGAGAMGGLLKYVTIPPDLETYSLRVGGGVSDVTSGDSGNDFRFGANLPLVKDQLALRVGYARNNLPGYIDDTVHGNQNVNSGSQTSGRVSLLWQGDAVSVQLGAMRQTIKSDNNATVALDPVTMRPIGGDLSNLVSVNEPFSKSIDYYSGTVNWDLGWSDFVSATGYSDTHTKRRQDTTVAYGNFADLALGLPAPGSSYFDTGLNLTKFSQEFRLASKSDVRFEWLVGTFYTHEKGNQNQAIFLNQLDGSPLADPYGAMFGTLASLELPATYKETAIFANGTYKFTDQFKLGTGVRYAKNDQQFSQNNIAGALVTVGQEPGSSSEGVFTWSLTPQFELSEHAMVYGKVATGYQPGGPNVAFPGLPSKVDSSTLTSYELGTKGLFVDKTVQIDLAAFHIDWKNIQVPASFGGKSGLVNGGKATSDGAELASVYRPNSSFELGFNAAYTKAN
ncbi:hypothetical protein ELE36_10500 [Pseudolysobacter antarcticus]|uniref:TonB-dependent receptor n=1 Tax=Pseudolysobacter antarcticus TaxID=2511995 RepID=A0A411HJP6_9GAMM|nr:TonB-dependent receptor [Pseudolysobacter antarcticus]QBB70752.1 hypothetical protein ELE36_10500 [Pseudolysobacter antarcticus]